MTTNLYNRGKGPTIRTIPFTNERYTMNENGEVFDGNEQILPYTNRDGRKVIRLMVMGSKPYLQPTYLDVLVTVVFKNVNIKPGAWRFINLFYKDDNPNNLTVTNLAHQIYPEELSFVVDGISYKIIPGFTNYGLSRCGKIIHRKTLGATQPYTRKKDGYVCFNLWSDLNQKWTNVKRHRILALCYYPYSKVFYKMDVNHKDGIPGSDEITNLEWATRSKNNNHAVDMGLNPLAETIEVKDCLTGLVTTYPSMARAARELKISPATITLILKKNDGTIASPYHMYRLKSDKTWPEVTITADDVIRLGKVLVDDGKIVTVYNSYSELSKDRGVNLGTLKWRFDKGNDVLIGCKVWFELGQYKVLPGKKLVID